MITHKWKDIKWKGIHCVQNVKKNYSIGIAEQYAYDMATVILKPYTNVKRNKLGVAPKPVGDKIKFTIPKNDYIQLAKNLIKFANEKGRMPNFLTYKGKRIRCRVYVHLFSQALAYFNEHKEYPKQITINYKAFYKPTPKPTYKKYGHSTEYGCDNRGQNNGYYCGPHMVQEIIRNLTGKVISQSTLAEVIGTTTDGSDHDGINTSFAWFNRKYGYNLKVQWYNFSDLGWDEIKKILESNNQDCGLHENYRDQWGHYTNYDKVYDDYVDVHNSLGDYCDSGCYCGYTEERDKSDARRYLAGISQKSVLVVTNES